MSSLFFYFLQSNCHMVCSGRMSGPDWGLCIGLLTDKFKYFQVQLNVQKETEKIGPASRTFFIIGALFFGAHAVLG